MWPQIVDALTKDAVPEEQDIRSSVSRGNIRDDVFYGTLDEVNEYFKEMNWSDGLPVIPPTFEKVESFMRYTDCRWNETVAVLPPAHRGTTAWHVAVNGVMAGCKPEYMPILIALTRSMGAPEFRRTGTASWRKQATALSRSFI